MEKAGPGVFVLTSFLCLANINSSINISNNQVFGFKYHWDTVDSTFVTIVSERYAFCASWVCEKKKEVTISPFVFIKNKTYWS